jgi:predicted metal-dependent hydrolase
MHRMRTASSGSTYEPHALLEDLRTRGVTLQADGLTLRVAAPEDVATEELHETVSRHKHALIRLLERERKKLEEAERLGLVIKWSREPGYVAIHDPTTGDWHELLASDCPPWMIQEARAYRRWGRGR